MSKQLGPITDKITVEQLDEMFDWVMNPKKAKLAWAIHIVKFVAVALYLYCRKQISEDTAVLSKQKFENTSIQNTRKEIDGEDLG